MFTGIVLLHDRLSYPHRILLENMCLQERDGAKNIFEGKHLWVSAGPNGDYELPFEDSHLEERGDGLVFVTLFRRRRVEERLGAGKYEPGTLSFEDALDTYEVRAIVVE